MSGGLKAKARRAAHQATAVLLAFGMMISVVWADALTDARGAGQIGERPDGFVALVDNNAPASVRQLVDEINAQRRAAFQDVANRTGAPLDQVGIRAAQRIYSEVPSGTYLLSQAGQWYRK